MRSCSGWAADSTTRWRCRRRRGLVSFALPDPWTILWNGVEVDRFAPAEPWQTDRPTVLFVGRHEERKGLAVLLAALEHLPAELSVWVAGEGPQTDELRAAHEDDERIEWLGRISDAERDSRMAGATVFCAPSTGGESFGVILIEAMAAGTPVLASDIDGYRQVAAGAASLFPPGDPRALAEALRAMLDDPDLMSRRIAAGHVRASELSMSRLAERYLGIYESVLTRVS